MRAVVILSKAGQTAGSIASMVPEDLEGVEQEDCDPDDPGPQTVGCPQGASSVRPVVMSKATYRDPRTKSQRKGTPIAYGSKGATVVDHQTGAAVRVEHGHHWEDDEPETTPDWKKTAQEHLELGPGTGHAIHALAAHAAEAGCEYPHELKRKDVSISGNRVTFGGKPVDDPYVAATARWLVDRDGPDEDLWSWEEGGKRQRLTGESVAAYRAKLGALPKPVEAEAPPQERLGLRRDIAEGLLASLGKAGHRLLLQIAHRLCLANSASARPGPSPPVRRIVYSDDCASRARA